MSSCALKEKQKICGMKFDTSRECDKRVAFH